MRWNAALGIDDVYFIAISDLVLNSSKLTFRILPMFVVFAKITPVNIEATFFAFLCSCINLFMDVISPFVGNQLNDNFVGVTNKDLSKYPTLMLISLCASFLPFFFLYLIPLREELNELVNEAPKAEA